MSEIINGEEYFTTEEAAKFLGITPNWFTRRTVPENDIEVFERGVGRELYYKKSQLEPLLKMRPRKKKVKVA